MNKHEIDYILLKKNLIYDKIKIIMKGECLIMIKKEYNDKLNEIFSNENINIETKKYLINLKKTTKEINNINNIEKVEKKVYKEKDSFEKTIFELERIIKYITKNNKESFEIQKELQIIDTNIRFKKIHNKNDYSDILKSIIRIEIMLGMKIGLLTETNDLFYEEVERYYNIIHRRENETLDSEELENYETLEYENNFSKERMKKV